MKSNELDEKLPKLSAVKMSLEGAKMLATAILLRAAEDYFRVCDQPDSISEKTAKKYRYDPETPVPALKTKGMLELFFKSDLFDAISDIPPDVFRSGIKKLKASGNKFPTITSYESPKKPGEVKLPKIYDNGRGRPIVEHSKF